MQDNVSSNPSFFSIRSFHFVEMTREISRLSLFLSFFFLITDLGVTQYRGQFTVTRTLHAFAPSVIIVLSTRDGTRISVGLGGEAHTSPFVNCLTCSVRLSHDRPWKIIRVRNIYRGVTEVRSRWNILYVADKNQRMSKMSRFLRFYLQKKGRIFGRGIFDFEFRKDYKLLKYRNFKSTLGTSSRFTLSLDHRFIDYSIESSTIDRLSAKLKHRRDEK